jgi:hypothetical protein
LRNPLPIHFKLCIVIGIDSLMVCILFGEISIFHSRVMRLYSSNCRRFFVCHAFLLQSTKISMLIHKVEKKSFKHSNTTFFEKSVKTINSNNSTKLPKVQVNYCHSLASVVCRLSSVNFSHFKLLLRNHFADWNRT